MMSVHEKGRNVIIQSGIYEKIVEPKIVPPAQDEAKEEDLSYLQMVILSAVSER